MVEGYRRRAPLAALAIGAGADPAPAGAEVGLVLAEGGPRAQLALRGDAAEPAFSGAVEAALGVAPPSEPNTVAGADDAHILWLGPDEWLAVFTAGREAAVGAALEEALCGVHALVSDVSHSRGVISLLGARAREVLAKGCSLDLHPSVFGPGRCAQSTFARCHVLVHQRDETPAFDLYVHRSFMEYAWAWLVDAAGPEIRLSGAPS